MPTGQTVYVTDASRAVGVVQSLLSAQARGAYIDTVRAEYSKVAEAHRRAEADKQRLPLAKARANAFKRDWASYAPPSPVFCGTRVFRTYAVAELIPYIDWTPFFQTWELRGRYPAILDDPKQGEAARQLFEDAQAMLKQRRRRTLVRSEGGHRLLAGQRHRRRYRALHGRIAQRNELATFFTLRQQLLRRDGTSQSRARRFRRPGRERQGRLYRRFRRHCGRAGRQDRRPFRQGQ